MYQKLGYFTHKHTLHRLEALEFKLLELQQEDTQDGEFGGRYQQLKQLKYERNQLLLVEALWRKWRRENWIK